MSITLRWLAALAVAAFSSCASVGTDPCDTGEGLDPDDPRLVELGLVYDDTIITQSGRTVDFNGQAVVPRFIRTEKSGVGGDLAVDVAMTNVVFGLDPNFTVSLGVPYIAKSLDRPGLASTLRSNGLGDISLTGKYRFYQNAGLGETTEASVIFGLELPTGRDKVEDDGVRLPAPLQPGSGSVDAVLGGAITRVDGRWLGSADLIAKLNTEANDFQFGNVVRADIGGHFRAHPARYERFDQLTVNLVAELNSVWIGRSRSAGNRLGDSGGVKLFATPGIQAIFNRYFLLEAAIQIPVAMDLNGNQLEEDFVAVFGLRARF